MGFSQFPHPSGQPPPSASSRDTTHPGPEGTQTEPSQRKDAAGGSNCHLADIHSHTSANPPQVPTLLLQNRAGTAFQGPLHREREAKGLCTPGYLYQPGAYTALTAFTAPKEKDGGGQTGGRPRTQVGKEPDAAGAKVWDGQQFPHWLPSAQGLWQEPESPSSNPLSALGLLPFPLLPATGTGKNSFSSQAPTDERESGEAGSHLPPFHR